MTFVSPGRLPVDSASFSSFAGFARKARYCSASVRWVPFFAAPNAVFSPPIR